MQKEFVTNYHPEAPFTVYYPPCWWSDAWDARDYGAEYDFSRPFFEQFRELWRRVPVIGLAADLPDHIRDVPDTILRETIGCGTCGKGFKIIPHELAFLRERSFPLPRRCPFCRISGKLDIWTQELKSVPVSCTSCGQGMEIASRYASEAVLLCKKCYQREIA